MKKTLLQLTVACALALAMTPDAQAQILADDAFLTGSGGYTAGDINGQNPPTTGFTGPWTYSFAAGSNVVAAPLTYTPPTGYVETPGAGNLVDPGNGSAGVVVGRSLAPSVTNAFAATSGTVYMSFELQEQSSTGGYQALELNADGGTNRVLQVGSSTFGDFGGASDFGIRVNNTVAGNFAVATDMNTHLFVLQFNLASGANNDTLNAWIDPTDLTGAAPTGGSELQLTGFSLSADINNLDLAAFAVPNTALSEIRIGATLEDIADIGEVPEIQTSKMTVLGLGALVVVMIVRRRRQVIA